MPSICSVAFSVLAAVNSLVSQAPKLFFPCVIGGKFMTDPVSVQCLSNSDSSLAGELVCLSLAAAHTLFSFSLLINSPKPDKNWFREM